MKDLYKPVFWCGFALSLSALYASTDKAVTGSDVAARKPVLLQIKIGQPTPEKVDSRLVDQSQLATGEAIAPAPNVSETPIPINSEAEPESSAPQPTGTSAFFSAAQEVLGRK